MISGKTIICFASGWDYHPTSKHHVMRRLAGQNNVVWVNWHASRRPSVGWSDLCRIGARLWQVRQGPRQVSDSISVITPGQIPMPGSTLARRFNARIVQRAVNRVLEHLPKRPVQIWSFAPDVSALIGCFDEELVLYYCVDAFGEFPGYNRGLIEKLEKELIDKSDLVITTSPPLYEAKRELHANVHLVQHGVDHARLSRAVEHNLPIPRELRNLPRPILGFVGIVGEWVDLDLIAQLAKRRPGASFVLIGPEMSSRGPCTGLPNVHWLGSRNHEVLPNYLRCFDVGLIPFKQTPLTYNANPIKLYEYLAAGVPAVCTTVPAVKALPKAIWLADDAQSMDRACTEALAQNGQANREERSRAMIEESWEARLSQIGDHIHQVLEARPLSVPATSDESEEAQVVRSA